MQEDGSSSVISSMNICWGCGKGDDPKHWTSSTAVTVAEMQCIHNWSYLVSWWRHRIETFSALLSICAGNSPVIGEFPTQRPVRQSFDCFFDLRLHKRLSKWRWGWWFETPSRSLWRHCNVINAPPPLFHSLKDIFRTHAISFIYFNENDWQIHRIKTVCPYRILPDSLIDFVGIYQMDHFKLITIITNIYRAFRRLPIRKGEVVCVLTIGRLQILCGLRWE